MIRKQLRSDTRYITVTDFGTGSDRNNNKRLKVSEIVKRSSVPERYCRLLSGLAMEFGNTAIVELGTSFGLSTIYMAAANPEATVYTIEGCPAISEIAAKNFMKARIDNIRLITGSFELVLPGVEEKGIRPGLVFIDGNHRKKPTLDYFQRMADISDENTAIVIDDIYYSPEMGDAWNEIKADKRVSTTIDLYRMGIVFFRHGMTRQDYKVRY